jgi:hypothetical protein
MRAELSWRTVWQWQLEDDDVWILLELIGEELDGHQSDAEPLRDADLAFGIDLLHRIVSGQFGQHEDDQANRAREMIAEAAALYPSAAEYVPDPVGPPEPMAIVEEIDALAARERVEAMEGEANAAE